MIPFTPTTENPTIQGSAGEQWSVPEGIKPFSEEHLYYVHRKGYHKGVNDGVEKEQRELSNLIKNNLVIAADDTNKVIGVLLGLGIRPISAHLKSISPSELKILITLSTADYLRDEFLEVYSKVKEIQENSKTEFYSIVFSFVNKSETFDNDLVLLDGYLSTFKPLQPNQ
jgi:hypothetical protein